MNTIIINDIEYYSAESLQKISPIFFKGCINIHTIISKKKIQSNYYIYAACKNDEWGKTEGLSKISDKVLFLAEWAKKNIPELANDEKIKHDVEYAPNIIILNDDEKMKDDNNNFIEIEVRGKREYDACFFRVKDVMIVFEMNNLDNTLVKKQTYYEEIIDYKFFNIEKQESLRKIINNKYFKKELFLTYTGLLKVLFSCHSIKTNNFVKWASETLFIVQMGTNKKKRRLVSNIMGVDPNVVREVFNKTSTTMPCIYLFSLGYVKDLRNIMKIDKIYTDNMIVYKWGKTIDLSRRTYRHMKTFQAYSIEPKLVQYNYVDPQFISAAETMLKTSIKKFGFHYVFDTMIELTILDKDNLRIIEEQFDQISKSFIGHNSKLISKIKVLENNARETELMCKLETEILHSKVRELEAIIRVFELKEKIYEMKIQNNPKKNENKKNENKKNEDKNNKDPKNNVNNKIYEEHKIKK